jgi:hypothetical protein
LFARTIKKFLVHLKRQHCILFDQLDESLTGRYLGKKEGSLFAMVKPSESSRTLDQLAEDVFFLTQHIGSETSIQDMSIFSVKHPRVRGMEAICFAAVMKAIGVKHFQVQSIQKVANRPTDTTFWCFIGRLDCLLSYQSAIQATITRIQRILCKFSAESVKSF